MMIALTRIHGLSRALGSFSSLRGCRAAQHVMYLSSSQEDSKTHARMLRHLVTKIKSTGPISVAEYMREVLTNPVTGYYVNNDMLGPDGDFITSPEISQVFGELLGVWCVSEWMGAGRPGSLQLVEFGPGRGSLMNDILRVLGQLRSALGRTEVSVHLVEVSPRLSQVQAGLLTGEQSRPAASEDQAVYRHGATPAGVPVSWYRHLDDVPRGFSLFLAHEFFDALPVHKFQRTPRGWREVMVDVDPEDRLRFVIIPAPTLASSTLIQVPVSPPSTLIQVPVSPSSSLIQVPVSPPSSLIQVPVSPSSSLIQVPVSPSSSLIQVPVSPSSRYPSHPPPPSSRYLSHPLPPSSRYLSHPPPSSRYLSHPPPPSSRYPSHPPPPSSRYPSHPPPPSSRYPSHPSPPSRYLSPPPPILLPSLMFISGWLCSRCCSLCHHCGAPVAHLTFILPSSALSTTGALFNGGRSIALSEGEMSSLQSIPMATRP
uniref:Protein arginine methyltransferase NDUFAF7 n=1 Tax=Gadus morhua TaxID=8049 RepID=A0A8C4ZRS4_GADMO